MVLEGAAPLLAVRDLAIRFVSPESTVHAVNGIDLDVSVGETLGLVGESGSGKSVSGLAITRLLPESSARIDRGSVWFDGRDLLTLDEEALRHVRGREIGMIFQDPFTSLNPILSVGTQFREGLLAHEPITRAEADARGIDLLRAVGIADGERRLGEYPHQLSGGMRQRVMIAMALALKPKLLIADEPTTALDVTIQAQVIEVIRELSRSIHTAVLIITHDLAVVADVADRIAVMYAGYVVETATTAELFHHPRHPYTVGLLQSIARVDSDPPEVAYAIPGGPPDPTISRPGCPFAPRCGRALPICSEENPALTSDGISPATAASRSATHLAACHNPVEARPGPILFGTTSGAMHPVSA